MRKVFSPRPEASSPMIFHSIRKFLFSASPRGLKFKHFDGRKEKKVNGSVDKLPGKLMFSKGKKRQKSISREEMNEWIEWKMKKKKPWTTLRHNFLCRIKEYWTLSEIHNLPYASLYLRHWRAMRVFSFAIFRILHVFVLGLRIWM